MGTITIGIGLALIALGAAGYSGSGALTALIPAAVGGVLLLCGVLARDAARRKLVMHIAVTVGLIGFLGSLPGLLKLPTLLSGGEVARPAAVWAQSIMAVLTGVFVALCVRSFIQARRNRQGA
jgi:hypothetical protein